MANLVIAGSKPKLASLLFDKVIPIPFDHLFHQELSLDGLLSDLPGRHPDLCHALLPRGMDANRYGIAILSLWVAITSHARGESMQHAFRNVITNAPTDLVDAIKVIWSVAEGGNAGFHLSEIIKRELQDERFEAVNFFGLPEGLSGFESYFSHPDDAVDNPLIQIGSVEIIDDRLLSWELVKEFRKDKSSRARLRALHNFAFENYKDKPLSYIENDINLKISEYVMTAKSWGLKTIQSIIGSSAIGTATGLVTSIAGAPASITAAIGASVFLGGTLVQIVTRRKLLEIEQEQKPIRYLVDIVENTEQAKD